MADSCCMTHHRLHMVNDQSEETKTKRRRTTLLEVAQALYLPTCLQVHGQPQGVWSYEFTTQVHWWYLEEGAGWCEAIGLHHPAFDQMVRKDCE